MKVVVKEAHKSNYPNPISFAKGEPLVLGSLDTKFIGWIRAITIDGNEGWAPTDYIAMNQSKTEGVAKCNYNASELDTEINESLTVISELNEWVFAINAVGEKGWIPVKTISLEPSS